MEKPPGEIKMTAGESHSAVFLSVAEGQKASLAQPFRDLLLPSVQGLIVSDLPLIGDAYTPEEKVDAYLERSQAVVVFATADLDAGGDRFTRPNIADEIGRARSKPHLRNRICVLKQAGVTLPSNTNPAYNHLDPDGPEPAFEAALEQLKAWGFEVSVTGDRPATPAARAGVARRGASADLPSPEPDAVSLDRALALVPRPRNVGGESMLLLITVPAPRAQLLRPSELEDAPLAGWLEREALYGDFPVLERGEGTKTGVTSGTLVARQSRASVAVNEEGAVVITRPLTRGTDRGVILRGLIEEEVLSDMEADIAFTDVVLAHVDPARRATNVVLVAALIGATYTAWRTRAQQAASPNSMSINVSGSDQILAHLSPAAQPRSTLVEQRSGLARDLMVLLRRQATKG
jgi:hypothetical protein